MPSQVPGSAGQGEPEAGFGVKAGGKPEGVIRAWYRGDAALALTQGACRLSRRPIAQNEMPLPHQTHWFAPRFGAEPGLWLAIPR